MNEKRLPARFYRSPTGNELVRDWLKQLPLAERKIIGTDIKTVEYGWPIGMTTCRSMGQGLFEVRSNLPNGKIARILFCIVKVIGQVEGNLHGSISWIFLTFIIEGLNLL